MTAFRASLSMLGDGFVEAIANNTLAGDRQRAAVRACAGR